MSPGLAHFSSPHYQDHNRARLTHLASLGLPLHGKRVLELGSGPGDHTGFYLDRRCAVTSVDARQDCLDVLQSRYPQVATLQCDLNEPAPLQALGLFDVIHCYGILYHLEAPAPLLAYMAQACSSFALVETCVRADDFVAFEIVAETEGDYTQSSTGRGCRPSRRWVFNELRRGFPFVYVTRTQPAHPEFPLDWSDLTGAPELIRSVFVASKQPLDLPSLSPVLLTVHEPAGI
jgi:SAM-dependent methyltransferase